MYKCDVVSMIRRNALLLFNLNIDPVLLERAVIEEGCGNIKSPKGQSASNMIFKLFEHISKELFKEKAFKKKMDDYFKNDFNEIKEPVSDLYTLVTMLIRAFGPNYVLFLQNNPNLLNAVSPVKEERQLLFGKKPRKNKKNTKKKKNNRPNEGGANTPPGAMVPLDSSHTDVLDIRPREEALAAQMVSFDPSHSATDIAVIAKERATALAKATNAGYLVSKLTPTEQMILAERGDAIMAARIGMYNPEVHEKMLDTITNYLKSGTEENSYLKGVLDDLKQQLLDNHFKNIESKKKINDTKKADTRSSVMKIMLLQGALAAGSAYTLWYHTLAPSKAPACNPSDYAAPLIGSLAGSVYCFTTTSSVTLATAAKGVLTGAISKVVMLGGGALGYRAASHAIETLPKAHKEESESKAAYTALKDEYKAIIDKNIDKVLAIVNATLQNIIRDERTLISGIFVSFPGKTIEDKIQNLVHHIIEGPKTLLVTKGIFIDESEQKLLTDLVADLSKNLDQETSKALLAFHAASQKSSGDMKAMQNLGKWIAKAGITAAVAVGTGGTAGPAAAVAATASGLPTLFGKRHAKNSKKASEKPQGQKKSRKNKK